MRSWSGRARDNPFTADRIHAVRCRLPGGLTWDALLDRLAGFGWRAAVVGPHGHGKTTLLGELASLLKTRGFQARRLTLTDAHRRLDRDDRRVLRSLGPRDVLLLDGAEQLGRTAWLEVMLRCRSAGGLVVTSHRPGLLPTLCECETTPELLAEIVRDLTGESDSSDALEITELFDRHGGNVREALRELYDRWAGRVRSSPRASPRGAGSSP